MPAWWLTRASSPAAVREACSTGVHAAPTAGLADGFVQANLVIVPVEHAKDFRDFCQRNPRPCPLLEELPPGERLTRVLAAGADLATCLPKYRVWRDGKLTEELTDLRGVWRGDLVAFLLGCSFSFEESLEAAGIRMRHTEEGVNVPMFVTSRQTEPAGPFRGPLVVSMRPLAPADVPRAVEITRRFPRVHGAPVHIGDPAALGIADVGRPDYGDAVSIRPGEVPCFWACGVTPQNALMEARLPFAITHAPGHMLVGDTRNADLAAAPRSRRRAAPLLLAAALGCAAAAVFVEEWRATPPGAGVASQSFATRALARLLEVQWVPAISPA